MIEQARELLDSSEQTRTTSNNCYVFNQCTSSRTPADIIREYELFKSIAEQVIELSLSGNEVCRRIYLEAKRRLEK